jgi:hypothetical protein
MSGDTIGENLCQVRDVLIKIVFFHYSPATCYSEALAESRVIYQALDRSR